MPGDFAVRQAYEYLDYCANCGFTGRHYNYHRAIASMLFEMMQNRQIIALNPFTKTTRQTVPEGSSTVFTPQQIETVRKHLAVKNPDLGVLCDFVYYTYLRLHELIQIQIKHFDFEGYRVLLTPEISKNKTGRIVHIPPALHWHVDQLRDAAEQYLEQYREKFPNAKFEDAYVFGWGVKLHPKRYAKRDSVSEMFRLQVRIPLALSKEHTLYVFKHSGVDAALKKGYS